MCVCVLCLSHFDISVILVGPWDVKPLVGFINFNAINVVKVKLNFKVLIKPC